MNRLPAGLRLNAAQAEVIERALGIALAERRAYRQNRIMLWASVAANVAMLLAFWM